MKRLLEYLMDTHETRAVMAYKMPNVKALRVFFCKVEARYDN